MREARRVTLEKNTAEFEIPVTADYAPNAYCSLTLIRPAEAEAVWSAHRAIGAIVLPVERPGSRLLVAVEAPAIARPQAALDAVVTVRDETGQPARGAVTVMAVDEAICMLTAFATPDPDRVFAAQRALGVAPFDLYAELMPVTDEQTETVPAAGGDGDAALRRRLNPIKANRFKPVALWRAAVPLDTNGQARVKMDLPEFNGELRLMAVAYGAAQAGATSMPVKVKRDLVVQPALPRFLAIGDRCEAAVALYNEGAAPVAAKVRATCGGPLRAETPEQIVEIPAGGSATAALPLTAGRGRARRCARSKSRPARIPSATRSSWRSGRRRAPAWRRFPACWRPAKARRWSRRRVGCRSRWRSRAFCRRCLRRSWARRWITSCIIRMAAWSRPCRARSRCFMRANGRRACCRAAGPSATWRRSYRRRSGA